MPALLTSTSSRPYVFRVSWIIALMAAGCDMSAAE